MTLRIDRYQVQRLVGQGAMGKVYLATDPKIGRQVAIKVLGTGAADDAVRQRFRLEARAIAALKHPNIVELYDYSGETAPDLFLVMEYIPGASLDTYVSKHGPMSEPTALCIAHELCYALAHAHKNNVVHRDLKPENVLLSQGRVVLTDFGVVKAVATSPQLGVSRARTRTQVLGTPGFMAPEQFSGRQIDHRTDLFSLGAVLYCLTTGKLPYEGGSVDAIYENLKAGKYEDPRTLASLLSPGFCKLLGRCLAPKPKDRYEAADQVRNDILSLLASHGVTEVRQELVEYEKNPAGYALEQRQRQVDVLLRDLKVALKDRDDDMAQSILTWLRNLAPLDDRFMDVTGIHVDPRQRAVILPSTPRRRAMLMTGVGVGFLLGVVLGAALDLHSLLPKTLAKRTDAIVQWLRPW